MRVRIFKLVTCKNLLVQDLITWIWATYRSPLALWWQVREVSPRNVLIIQYHSPTDPITFWDCNHLTLSAIAHVVYTRNVCVYRFTIHVLYSYVYIVQYTYMMWHAIGARGVRFAACNWTTCHISVCNMLLQFDCTPFDIPCSTNLYRSQNKGTAPRFVKAKFSKQPCDGLRKLKSWSLKS